MAHLLLIEDDPSLQLLYRLELAHDGHDVRVARTLTQAREEIAATLPSLVLLDLRLPDADGLAALTTIAEILPEAVPIVVNSAYGHYREHLPTDRPTAYVIKSSDLTELLQTVRDLCAGQTCRKANGEYGNGGSLGQHASP